MLHQWLTGAYSIDSAAGEELEATKEKYDADIKLGDLLKQFRVYFPTVDTVRASKGGEEVGFALSYP